MPELISCWDQVGLPILSIIAYLPLVGALAIIFFSKKDDHKRIMWSAFAISVIDFLISLVLVFYFVKDRHCIQFVEKVPWIKSLGIQYYFGIDGVSILLVLLTTFLGMLAILSSFTAIKERVKEYYVFMLLLQTGMLGVFMALDFFLFYIFWEVMLVPMYFLIGVWGGPRKLYAAIKFFLYTLFGSVFMLLGILALYFYHHSVSGEYTFEIFRLYDPAIPYNLQIWVFLAFFLGFAIKVPMFPFHTWLPDAHVEAPTAGSVILAGVLLKMGTYGFVRFSLPMFPDATIKFLPWMIFLCIVGIIYGALVAMMQPDLKKLVAYSSVSHLGFCMLGVFALNIEGLKGGMLQMINHGLSTGALFLIVGLIYERRHTRMIADFGGLSKVLPVYSMLFMIITLSSIGLPGLNGFIGEFLVLVGVFKVNIYWAACGAIGIVLGAAYMLWMFQRVMFGKITHEENEGLKDLDFREIMTLVPIVFFCVWIGIYPSPFLRFMDASLNHTIDVVNRAKQIEPLEKQMQPAGEEPVQEPASHSEHALRDNDHLASKQTVSINMDEWIPVTESSR